MDRISHLRLALAASEIEHRAREFVLAAWRQSTHGFQGFVQEFGHQRIICASPSEMEGLRSTFVIVANRPDEQRSPGVAPPIRATPADRPCGHYVAGAAMAPASIAFVPDALVMSGPWSRSSNSAYRRDSRLYPPSCRSSRRIVIPLRASSWKNGGLPRSQPAWNGINRLRLRAGSILASRALRSHLISDVDWPQERLIIICKDECASRVAITRGLLVRP